MTEQKHWAAEKAARDRLLAFGMQHGLDSKGVLDVLHIKKLSDHKGTEAEAVGAIADWANKQAPPPDEPEPPAEPEPAYAIPTLAISDGDQVAYFEACTKLPETPIIAWTVFQDTRGYEWSYTIHAGLPARLQAVARQIVAADIAAFHEDASRYGWMPLIDTRRAGGNGNGAKTVLPTLQSGQLGKNGIQMFSPQSLEYAGKSNKGSLYWKAKGHPFNQYGVTVWEEALPAELKERAKADLTQDLDITGWVATYTLQPSKNDPDQMVPDKVVKLEKAA